MDRERIREQIRQAGMRATASRIAVIEKLRSAGRPLTHGDLSDELVPKGFDRASIFRNLVDLTQAGLVSRTDLGDHAWRFHAAGGEDLSGLESSYARHPHFVCIECGGIQCLEAVEVTVKAARKRAPKAVLRTNVEINFRGHCDACIAMA
jgi:Fur family ferric uptake transcriptional regulator